MRILGFFAAVVCAALVVSPSQAQQDNQKTLEAGLKSLQNSDPMERALGLVALALIGKDAKVASKEIIELLNDPNAEVSKRAVEAITAANPDIAAAAITLAQGTDLDKRIQAAEQLGKLGKDGSPALSLLLPFLDKTTGADRVKVLKALASAGAEDKKAAEAIAKAALTDNDPKVREAALAALPKMADSKAQVGTMIGALKERDTQKRLNAISALGAVGKGNLDALKALEALANDPSAQVRDAAKKAVAQLKANR